MSDFRLETALAQFLTWAKSRRKIATIDLYKFYLTKLVEQVGNINLVEISRGKIETWEARRVPLQVAKVFFKWCHEVAEIIPVNPTVKIKTGKSNHRNRVLSRLETLQILRVAPPRLRSFLFSLRETGARPGEARSFSIEHLQHCRGGTADRAALLRGDCLFELKDFKARVRMKNSAKTRVIPISPRLGRLIARRFLGSGVLRGKPLFVSPSGEGWSMNSLRMGFRRTLRKAAVTYGTDVAGLCPYHFRHTKATELARKGKNAKLLAEFLGHTTMDLLGYYIHPSMEDLCNLLRDDNTK